ncbi:MAG: translation initiation factor IF-2 N-terminal domain-containing protein [Pseudonocardiaceae bacterium]
MANREAPAGGAGGPVGAPNGSELATSLPDKLRVHALAKLLSVSSKEIMATLAELGVPARSAQSSIDRDTAWRVVDVLLPDPGPDAARIEQVDLEPAEVEYAAVPGVPLAPVFNPPAPVFLPPSVQPPSVEDLDADGEEEPSDDEDEVDAAGVRRRRRRGRRGRGRGKGSDGTEDGSAESDESATAEEGDLSGELSDEPADDGEAEESGETGVRRRRRRRRRRGVGDDEAAPREDDPPDTVVHVREIRDRPAEDEVQAVRGSTRLEAKRQRRRDGREAGRRRAPILSESEFLTRREAVARTMIVREDSERTQLGVLEDGVLVEHFVTASSSGSLVGNVYLGKVQNVLPSMEAAFVDIGRGRNAVLYAGEVDWDAAGLEGKARRIEQALSSGDSVLVQVTKDPVGHKGARLTTQISLPGRFLVYVPGGRATGISRKLPDVERKRLKEVLKRILPEDAGVIIRTASEGVSEEELARDVRRLHAQWEIIQGRSGAAPSATVSGVRAGNKVKAPELLYEEPDLLVKVVRDLFTEDFRELVVQGDEAWDTVEAYVKHVAPDLMPRVRRYTGTDDVFADFRIDEQITKALDRKVWLPSGGYLVIDRTEAMTVIDVNTGKFTGSGGNLEETVTRNNLEAAEEIVRQLRLRDIGGIIVIDFIDMVLESNRDLVLRRLTECLGRDRTRHQVAEVTSLGLVQMTRKKIGTGLLEAHSTPCEHCKGRGVLVSVEPVNVRIAAPPVVTGGKDSGGNGTRRARSRGRGDGGGSDQAAVANGARAGRDPAAAWSEPPEETPSAAEAVAPPPEAVAPPPEGAAAEHTAMPDAVSVPDAAPENSAPALTPATGAPEVPAQPEVRSTTRRRRAASRPAGPPATDGSNGAGTGAQVSSAGQVHTG